MLEVLVIMIRPNTMTGTATTTVAMMFPIILI
jgi:hypothetical protein